jgi:isoleucyl-tRNA synthetase
MPTVHLTWVFVIPSFLTSGHALNKILKDIVNRYKMLKGHRVSYIPGWDCHGLPIELKALEAVKKVWSVLPSTLNSLTKNAKKGDAPPTPTQLRRLARETALQQIEQQKQAFVSWGVMGDWENAYKTMGTLPF